MLDRHKATSPNKVSCIHYGRILPKRREKDLPQSSVAGKCQVALPFSLQGAHHILKLELDLYR
jgi:hypothetical protein